VACRPAALTALGLVAVAAVFFAVGFRLISTETCTGVCERLGLTLLYAGGPVSAVFGVVGGQIVIAWPVDIVLWILLAVLAVRVAERRGTSPRSTAAAIIGAALVVGFALSFLVELT
jgi:hypothetical protein